jgi:hypothetical protein
MKKVVLLSVLLSLLLCSCKKWQHKYPEDAERTKLTPMERIVDKKWTLVQTTFNSVDYTDSVFNFLGKYEIIFSKIPESAVYVIYSGSINTDLEGGVPIVWNFSRNMNNIGFARKAGVANYFPFAPCYDSKSSNYGNYTILKLSENEFKIQFDTKNKDTTIINSFVR